MEDQKANKLIGFTGSFGPGNPGFSDELAVDQLLSMYKERWAQATEANINWFVGHGMKHSGARANPNELRRLLLIRLKARTE